MVIGMTAAIVALKTDLTNEELAKCISIVAKFFCMDHDQYKRTASLFPAVKTKPDYLAFVLSEGSDQVEALCDYEEEQAVIRDLDDMHDAGVFIYGNEKRDHVDLEIEDVPKDGKNRWVSASSSSVPAHP